MNIRQQGLTLCRYCGGLGGQSWQRHGLPQAKFQGYLGGWSWNARWYSSSLGSQWMVSAGFSATSGLFSHLETTQLYSSWAWHEVIFPSLILMSVICPFVLLMILNQSTVAALDTLPAPVLVLEGSTTIIWFIRKKSCRNSLNMIFKS